MSTENTNTAGQAAQVGTTPNPNLAEQTVNTPAPVANTAPPAEVDPFDAMFTIDANTKSSNASPIIPTEKNPFTMVRMGMKIEEKTPRNETDPKTVIVITFTTMDGINTHNHLEWPIDKEAIGTDGFAKKLKGFNARIKHIYDQFATLAPDEQIGSIFNADGTRPSEAIQIFKNLFISIVEKFNTGGKDGAPIYANVPCWLKITIGNGYDEKGFQIPLGPNFLERVKTNDQDGSIVPPKTLSINPKYESIIQNMKAGSGVASGKPGVAARAGGAFPDFPDQH